MIINEENFLGELRNKNIKALYYLIDHYGWIIKSIVNKSFYHLIGHKAECINYILMSIWDNINTFDIEENTFENWIASISTYETIRYKKINLGNISFKSDDSSENSSSENISKGILESDYNTELGKFIRTLSYDDGKIFSMLYIDEINFDKVKEEFSFDKNIDLKNTSSIYDSTEKYIYYLLNKSKINFNDIKRNDITEIELKKIKKKLKKSIDKRDPYYILKNIMIAMTILVIPSLYIFSKIVEQPSDVIIPARDISELLWTTKNLDKYSTVVNKSVTRNGVTIRINEVILDIDDLYASVSVYTDTKDPMILGSNSQLYINGHDASTGTMSTSVGNDQTAQFLEIHDLDKDYTGNNLKIKMIYSEIQTSTKDVKGKWVFEFDLDAEKLYKDSGNYNLNHEVKIDDNKTIKFKKYRLNDVGQRIWFDYVKNKDPMEDYQIMLKGEDDLGNKVDFNLYTKNEINGIFESDNSIQTLNEDAKELTLALYYGETPEIINGIQEDVKYRKVGKSFKINLTKLNYPK